VAALSDEEREQLARRRIELANEECLRKGVTSFQDAGASYATVERYRTMYEEDRLDVRLWVMLSEDNEALAARMDEVRTIGDAGGRLTVRAIKRVADGALGSHGAWLLEPYADQDSTGLNTQPMDYIAETARLAREHDFQLCVHAIGDRANRETLDVFEAAFGDADGGALRWRVEHSQHLSAEDIPRFASLGVIPSMQAVHCTSDSVFVPLRLGDARAAEGAYVWRKLLDSGARIVNGTDAPVEDVDPLASFYSSVTRRSAGGEPFYPEQAMTRMEALRSYTADAAWAGFEEAVKGTLTAGKFADVVVLSHDILTVPEEELPEARVALTIVGGRVVYEAE
jgi:hypothetical protein